MYLTRWYRPIFFLACPLALWYSGSWAGAAAANRGNFKEAHAALIAASQALGNYASNQGVHSADARMVKSQIDNVNQSIDQNHADADSKIDLWWGRVVDWTTTSTEQSRR
jgi:hypothetical protein